MACALSFCQLVSISNFDNTLNQAGSLGSVHGFRYIRSYCRATSTLSQPHPLPLHEHKPYLSRMVNLNGTTPQLKAAKRVVDAYSSRDLTNSGSVFSKDFKFQSFPKASEHVQETKGGHFQKYDPILGSFAKMEVRITLRNRLQACMLMFTTLEPFSRSD